MQIRFKSLFIILLFTTASFAWANPLCDDIQQWRDQRQDLPYWLMVVNLPGQNQSSLVEIPYAKAPSHAMIDYFIDTKDQYQSTVLAASRIGGQTHKLDMFFDYHPQFQQNLLTGVKRPGVYDYGTTGETIALTNIMYAKKNVEEGNQLIVPFVSISNGFTIHEYNFDLQTWVMPENSPKYYKSINQIEVSPNAVFRLKYQSSIWLVDDEKSYEIRYNNNRWEGVPYTYLEELDEKKDLILPHITKSSDDLNCKLD